MEEYAFDSLNQFLHEHDSPNQFAHGFQTGLLNRFINRQKLALSFRAILIAIFIAALLELLSFSSPPTNMRINFPGERGNLYYAVLAAAMGSVALGTHGSWASPTIPQLQAEDSWLPLNDLQVSWVVSLEFFGITIGPFIGGLLVNRVGRRGAIFVGVIFNCVAWSTILLTTLTYQVWQLYVGRLIGGLGLGIEYLACPMYTAEVSEPAVRGFLGSVFATLLVGGYQMGYMVGPYVSFPVLIFVNLVPTVIFFLLFPMIPESPHYYLRKGMTAEALESLTWLRTGKSTTEVQAELNEIQDELRQSMEHKAKITDLVATRGIRAALAHSMVVVIAQELSGIDVILSYAEKIFILSGATFSSSVSAIILGLVLFVTSAFACPLVRLYGMKNMLVASGIGMFFSQVTLAGYFYFLERGEDMSSYNLIPVTSLVVYISFFTVGFGVLAWAVVAEVFPSHTKPLAPVMCTFANKLTAFLLIKFFLQVSDLVGTYAVFLFFALCSLLAGIYVLLFLPDTRGMTFQEIFDVLEGKKTEKNESYEVTHF